MPVLGRFTPLYNWAALWQNQQNGMCAQRRLRSAWASAQWIAKDPSFFHADNEDSDQTGRMPKLIWVFAGDTFHFVGFVTMQLNYIFASNWKLPFLNQREKMTVILEILSWSVSNMATPGLDLATPGCELAPSVVTNFECDLPQTYVCNMRLGIVLDWIGLTYFYLRFLFYAKMCHNFCWLLWKEQLLSFNSMLFLLNLLENF